MRFILPAFLLLTTLAAGAQTRPEGPAEHPNHRGHGADGELTGRVATAAGQPVEGAAVALRGTVLGTTTGADGRFRLRAPAGGYHLVISSIGYAQQEQDVQIAARQTTALGPLALAVSDQALAEVTVTAGRSLNQRPTAVGKMPLAPLDLPQSAVTVERAVLEQQQVLRLSDALVNVSGLYVLGTTGGTQEELGSRGFAYGSSNTFKNGVRFNNGIIPEASSLERLEVLKGSAAILYGNVAAGGVLNLVTKKPQFERGGSVGVRAGSFGFVKPTFDVYGAVGQSDQVAFRLNGTYERGNSYRDGVRANRVYVNPSLLFNLSPRTTLLVEGDYLHDRRAPDFGIGAIDYVVQDSRSRFLNTADAANRTDQTSATATLSTRLNSAWTLKAVGGFQRYDNELRSGSRPIGINTGARKASLRGDWGRSLQRLETAENYYLAEVDLTGTFRTGALAHTLLVGADADQYHTNTLNYTSQLYDSLNILDPSRALGAPKGRTSGYDALAPGSRTLGNTRRAGIYAQDLVSLLPGLKLLAGLRWSYQETPSDVYTYSATGGATTVAENRRYDHAFSPRLGLVYQPVKTTALFASYASSFTPQSNTTLDTQGNNLAPSIIDQFEAGIKNDLFGGALSTNLTLYHIVNSNQTQTVQQYLSGTTTLNPSYNPRFPNAQELAGEVTSQGLEVDVQSRPLLGWSLIAGYSYNRTAYTKSNLYADGSRLRYTPAHTANLSLFYNFGTAFGDAWLRGLTAGTTGYFVGDRLAGRNPRLYGTDGKPLTGADANKFIALPNYFLFDATLGYTYERVSLRLKAANLLNALSYNVHDDNSVNPIAPRTYAATVGYRF